MKRLIVLILILLIFIWSTAARARVEKDMAGREVEVPEKISRVFAATPLATYTVYAIDPSVIIGINFPFAPEEKEWLNPRVVQLPILGGFFGQGRTINLEMLLKADPEVVIVWRWKKDALNRKVEETLSRLKLPVYYIVIEDLEDYADAFVHLGKLLNKPNRGKKLSDYAHAALKEVSEAVGKIPEGQKKRVYYAEGLDGLSTECHLSFHAMLIELAGGYNVHRCSPFSDYGREGVSFETVMLYKPDVILVQDNNFFGKIKSDRHWRVLAAVKQNEVYLIPKLPFNWFDRPSSFMRLLGLKWLANLLYPEEYKINISAEAIRFYKLFLQLEINRTQIKRIMYQ